MRALQIKLFTLLFMLMASGQVHSQCSELFFSEYIEGSSSNRAFEIYNPTNSTINLSDYVVYRNNNGSTTPSDSLFPQGNLAPYDVFVATNPGTSLSFLITESDTTHSITFYNGDDALWLKKISTQDTIDVIGQIGVDPGSGWPVGSGATNNNTLIRQILIQQGNTNWAIGTTEWDVFPIDMDDSLGNHTMYECFHYDTLMTTSCDSSVSPDGNETWTSSGIYMDTIPTASVLVKDTVFTVNLTINTVNTSIVVNDPMITSNAVGAQYKWLDCLNNYAVIPGATSQNFTPSVNGDYAVEVTENNCTDTSACETISTVDILENALFRQLIIYPNPTEGHLLLDFSSEQQYLKLNLLSLSGQTLQTKEIYHSNVVEMEIGQADGLYLLEIINGFDERVIMKIIKRQQ